MKAYIKFTPDQDLATRKALMDEKISRLGNIEIFEFTLHAQESFDTAVFVPDDMKHFDLFLVNASFLSVTFFLGPPSKWPHLDKTSDL